MSALPRNVTRNQALAFAALCLVAGLGFGALVRDDSGAASADSGAESAGKLPEKAASLTEPSGLAESEATNGSEEPEPVLVAADAGGAETVPESDVATLASADAAPEEDAPEEGTPEEAELGEMLAAAAEADTPCVVTLDVLPRAAEITMAEVRSEASASEMLVPCGEHEVRIVHPRYQNYSASFEVLPGEATTLRARLARPSVYLRIVSTPAKADVTINSRRVGKTPLRHKLPAFQAAKVQVSSPGYKSYSTKYYVKKPGTLKINLRRASKKNTKKKSSSSTPRRSANR